MRKKDQHKDALLFHLGNALRNRRLCIDLTQQELAAKANLHRTYINDVEAGHRNISVLTYRTLTDALLCALSLPMIETERSMVTKPVQTPFGVKGGLSKSSRSLRASNHFCRDLNIVALELRVKAEMSQLQSLVELFEYQHKNFPSDKGELEQALSGQLSINPFTRMCELPSMGTALDELLATKVACFLRPGEIEYSPLKKGDNYIIRGGGADGKGLPGATDGSTYVLSGNLRTDNQP